MKEDQVHLPPRWILKKKKFLWLSNLENIARMTIYSVPLCILKFLRIFSDFKKKYGDVSVLPTLAYFHGLEPGEEISITIEEGKTLFIKLLHVGEPDEKVFVPLLLSLMERPELRSFRIKALKVMRRKGESGSFQ